MGCFFIYLEEVFREIRRETELDIIHPNEIMYADDVIFISMEKHKDVDKIQEVPHKNHLKVDNDKTEYTTIKRGLNNWKKSKKENHSWGTKWTYRGERTMQQPPSTEKNKLSNDKKIQVATKLKMYKTLEKSILLYNCSTWALTKTQEQEIDAFHRKQLRQILGIRYFTKISNASLFKKTGENIYEML